MFSSVKSLISFAFIVLIMTGCRGASTNRESSFKNSIFQSSYFVERYGQIVGKEQTAYLAGLKRRLLTSRVKAINPSIDFRIILLNTSKPMAFSAGSGYILISKGLVLSFQTEAELAFAVAHEMAHYYLGHSLDQKSMPDGEFTETNEKYELEADYMAAGMMAFAGYDPHYAIQALRNTYSRARLTNMDVKGYPDLQTRTARISAQISKSGWTPPGTIDRRQFQSFRRSLL